MTHAGMAWDASGYKGKYLNGKLLQKICLCSTFLGLGMTLQSYEMTGFEK